MDPIVIPAPWRCLMPASRFRVIRPTTLYAQVLKFYEKGVGLPKLGEFFNHSGYDGTMLGMPGEPYHLEIVCNSGGAPNPCPNKDNGLVFYIEDTDALNKVAQRIEALGYTPVEAKNPWWGSRGAITFEDPDGWPVILSPCSTS